MDSDKEFLQQVRNRRRRPHKRKRISLSEYAEKVRLARILSDYYSKED